MNNSQRVDDLQSLEAFVKGLVLHSLAEETQGFQHELGPDLVLDGLLVEVVKVVVAREIV